MFRLRGLWECRSSCCCGCGSSVCLLRLRFVVGRVFERLGDLLLGMLIIRFALLMRLTLRLAVVVGRLRVMRLLLNRRNVINGFVNVLEMIALCLLLFLLVTWLFWVRLVRRLVVLGCGLGLSGYKLVNGLGFTTLGIGLCL